VTYQCVALDNVGNQSVGTATYSVIYNFGGFRPPIDRLPAMNTVKAGSAVPVKFSLHSYQGLNIFDTNYPKPVSLSCGGGIDAPVDEIVTAGSSSLSYIAQSDQYNYVWKTDKAWANTCRQLIVRFNDGKEYRASFKFAK
jgi:hypothetical protein